MVVMILERVPRRLRGMLSRWLIEPAPGIFVGHVSARVRDLLWDKCVRARQTGGIIQIWSTNNEQRFQMRVFGLRDRNLIFAEGLQLISIQDKKRR